MELIDKFKYANCKKYAVEWAWGDDIRTCVITSYDFTHYRIRNTTEWFALSKEEIYVLKRRIIKELLKL